MTSPFSSLKKTKKVPLRPLPGLTSRERYQSGSSDTTVCPTDHDLIGLLATRLSAAEAKVRSQNAEITERDMKIQMLEEKVKVLSMRVNDGNKVAKFSEIETKYLQLQKQVLEMEEFLADYGLVWVGNTESRDRDTDGQDITTGRSPDAVWSQSESLPQQNEIDFNLFVAKVKELNILCGEGVFKIEHTADGARLKAPDPVNLILYANGLVLFNGPFRPFSDPSTRSMVRDILDGYFPSELQNRYPEGIPLKLNDRRNVHFRDIRSDLFNGEGQTLGGNTTKSRLVNNIHSVHPQPAPSNEIYEESELPGPKLTVDQFLNKLPTSVIKNGQIIDIRQSVRQQLRPSPGSVLSQEVDCREPLDSTESQLSTDEPCVNLRIISEDGDNVIILKMLDSNTIGDVRKYLDKERKSGSKSYNIVSAFPHKIYEDDSSTLHQCGLTSNVTLHLRKK